MQGNEDIRVIEFDRNETNRNGADSKDPARNITTPQSQDGNSPRNSPKLFKIIIITVIALIIIGLVVCLIILLKKNNDNKIPVEPEEPNNLDDSDEEAKKKLKPIYKMNNTVGDLKRINVQQTSYKNNTVDGQLTQILIFRNTTYDIYIMSEKSPDEKNKNFYSNKYTASINIVKECYSYKEEKCEPIEYMDFSVKETENNLRRLPELTNFNISVPICLFNFTDNDVITSFKCPMKLSESKKSQMVLDLYFFRPPALERIDVNNPSKNPLKYTLFESKKLENGTFYREQNSGICDVYNAINTECTTDMNTTTDLFGNLIAYDEVAFSDFYTDENNSYVKNKITHLKDITDETKYLNKEEHKNQINYLFDKFEPYIKYDEYFSDKEFEEVYNVIKGNSTKIEEESNLRILNDEFNGINSYVKEESLFHKEISGVQINLNLRNDAGIDKSSMTASSLYKYNDNEEYLGNKFEISHIDTLLTNLIVLSKAGNKLADNLYQNIKKKFDDITKDISSAVSSLNNLINYDDLGNIFDSTLTVEKLNQLPTTIISESERLLKIIDNKLFDMTEISNYRNSLNKNIYNFVSDSHNLVNGLLEKAKELSDKLGSSRGKLTEIATYYLNNTSTSYSTVTTKVENILRNYYINETELISEYINSNVSLFGENIKNSTNKEIGIIENVKIKLENKSMTINLGNENDLKNVILNIDKSINGISDIISNYEKKLKSSLDLKTSGYFIKDDEIESTQKRVNSTIESLKENTLKFDNDELIDKIFDEKMSNFRQNFTQLSDYMNNKRDENFMLLEDVLGDGNFNQDAKKKFSNNLENLRSSIVTQIKEENENYMEEIRKKINDLALLEKNSLNNLIIDVDSHFSGPILSKLNDIYNKTFENSFKLLIKQINENKQLSNSYLDYVTNVISDDEQIIALLYPSINRRYKYKISLTIFLKSKRLSMKYLTKYYKYLSIFNSTINYINNQMFIDLSNEYKNLIIKIKTLLQSVKNNKLSDEYSDLTELKFVDDNINKIDNLYTKLDGYFSEALYNEYYLKKFITFKQNQIKEIENIKKVLIDKHTNLTNKFPIIGYYTYDFYATTTKIKVKTCTNGAFYYSYPSDYFGADFKSYSNSHNQLISPSIKSEDNLKELETAFNNFYSFLSKNLNEYNNVLTTLKNNIASLETDAINSKEQLNNLTYLNGNITSFLDQKYGDTLIKDSYDFYQKLTENNLKSFLDDINEKWIESFKIMHSEINLNKNNFTNRFYEFYIMGSIYKDLLTDDIIYSYTDQIKNQQKNEFNYTISYYYNYLYSSVNKAYQYMIGKIPTNQKGLNNILNYRRNQINEKYKEIIQKIKNSENNALNGNTQINLLLVPFSNFFKVNNLIQDKITYISTELTSLISAMKTEASNVGKEDTEYSLAARLYLENSQNGKVVEELSNSKNLEKSINLNQEKFEELFDSSVIYDQEDLISGVNKTISQSTSDIVASFKIRRQDYYEKLEKQITVFFTKDSLDKKIISLYKNGVNDLDENSRNKTVLNVEEILELITSHMKNESERLMYTMNYNSDYETIKNTIKNYKEEIFNKVKNEMTYIFETLRKNIYDKVYTNYIEDGLDKYLNEINNTNSNYTETKTLGTSFNIGNEINEMANDLINEYKNYAKVNIESDVIKSDYYKTLNLEGIEQLINETLENAFNLDLLPALKKYANSPVSTTGLEPYDFSNEIKNNIQLKINENAQKIKNIMSETKGENYEVEIEYSDDWQIMDFSEVYRNVIKVIYDDFNSFINTQIINEKDMFYDYFEKIIKSNFDEMMANFITTFGDKFFERIGDYNLLNKVDNLYNNFDYSSLQTFFYYLFVLNTYENSKFNQQKDLKYKLIRINDIDSTIEQSKDIIIKIITNKIDDFIEKTCDSLVDKYVSEMKQDDKNTEFLFMNENLKDSVKSRISLSKIKLETIYKNYLENHLKIPLIKKYENHLTEAIKALVKKIKGYQEDISSLIRDIPTIDTEEDLNEINEKINSTLKQVEDYNEHFKQFKIPENTLKFLSSYGNNTINPMFENIISLINSATKDIIFQYLTENSEKYEKKLDITPFNNKVNELYSFFNKTYMNPMFEQIKSYDAQNYEIKLNNEKDKVRRRRRNLKNRKTEEDIKQENNERVADKPLDDTFSKLLNTSNNTKNFVDSLSEFNYYDNLISKYRNNVKKSVEKSSKLISDNNYEENIANILNNQLSYLEEITSSYYNNINSNFTVIRNYIKNSINEINDELKKCANVTYDVFAKNYHEILSDEAYKSINTNYESNRDELKYNFDTNTSNTKDHFETTITNVKECSEFKFDINYEEKTNIRIPKIFAKIENKHMPDKMEISNYEPVGETERVGNKFTVDLKDTNASYTTIINFDTKSTYINITTKIKYDKYSYVSVPYERKKKNSEADCFFVGGKQMCIDTSDINYEEKEDKINAKTIYIDGKDEENTDCIEY